MQPMTLASMFDFTYEKFAHEIREKLEAKIKKVEDKVAERRKRVADLREEHGIDDAALVQLLQAARKNASARHYTYSTSKMSNVSVGSGPQEEERTIASGVVNNLLTENDFIEAERDQIRRMNLIARNLRPVPAYAENGTPLPERGFSLSYEELEFLEF